LAGARLAYLVRAHALADAGDRFAAAGFGRRLDAAARARLCLSVLEPLASIYDMCCLVMDEEAAQYELLQEALAGPQGAGADCALMVAPVLRPNVGRLLRYIAGKL
jgi:hypothetical protein